MSLIRKEAPNDYMRIVGDFIDNLSAICGINVNPNQIKMLYSLFKDKDHYWYWLKVEDFEFILKRILLSGKQHNVLPFHVLCEIIDTYVNERLQIAGNESHLAHTKRAESESDASEIEYIKRVYERMRNEQPPPDKPKFATEREKMRSAKVRQMREMIVKGEYDKEQLAELVDKYPELLQDEDTIQSADGNQ